METNGSRPTAKLRVIRMLPTMKLIRSLLSVGAAVVVVGCGAATATSGASSPTPVPVDVAGAQRAHLTLVRQPTPVSWVPCFTTDNYVACLRCASGKARQ